MTTDPNDLLRRIAAAVLLTPTWDADNNCRWGRCTMGWHLATCLRLTMDGLMDEARALLAQPVPSLDAAWARVEAALPDEYRFQSVYWHALDGGFTAVVYPIDEEVDDAVRATAPTPIAALHALADALEARK